MKQLILQKVGAHPRLFLPAGGEAALKQKIAGSPELVIIRDSILASAEKIIPQPTLTRVLTGKRLLSVSREFLIRVSTLGMAWRLTGDSRYLDRAQKEMLAIAAFSDWHPEHFLDVAEMTNGMAIGYDWFYAGLDAQTRTTCSTAIIEKGLKPSLTGKMSWVRGGNNWNQVCNGGMVMGALAIADEQPDLAAQIIVRAVDSVPYSMKEYGPDGAFPEGPGYWDYATTYTVILLEAMQSTLGTDYGLSQTPGFLASGDFMLHVTGPTGLYFNFSDSGAQAKLEPPLYWIAAQRHDPELLWFMNQMVNQKKVSGSSVLPLVLIWADSSLNSAQPKALDWKGNGENPVAFFRSGWGPDAVYVGIKGGTPSASHAHMDEGSFVFDAQGVRWAHSLGMQDYNSLESKGINLFNFKQDSERWQIFRISNESKNMLMFNDQIQSVKGKATITTSGLGSDTPSATVDCSTVFAGQAQKVVRTYSLQKRHTLLIEDSVQSVAKEGNVRWQMMTHAQIEPSGSIAKLTENGKTLMVRCLKPVNATWTVVDASAPRHDYDAPNPGMHQLVLNIPVKAGDSPQITVSLEPGN